MAFCPRELWVGPFKLGWFHAGMPITEQAKDPYHKLCHPYLQRPSQSHFPRDSPCGCLSHPHPSKAQQRPSLSFQDFFGDALSNKGGPRAHKAFSLPEYAILSFLQGYNSETIWFQLP